MGRWPSANRGGAYRRGAIGSEAMSAKRRIGLVGYGKLGQFIADAIVGDETIAADYELAFVWNQAPQQIHNVIVPREQTVSKQCVLCGSPAQTNFRNSFSSSRKVLHKFVTWS